MKKLFNINKEMVYIFIIVILLIIMYFVCNKKEQFYAGGQLLPTGLTGPLAGADMISEAYHSVADHLPYHQPTRMSSAPAFSADGGGGLAAHQANARTAMQHARQQQRDAQAGGHPPTPGVSSVLGGAR
jgi:hypothetical protein